MMLYLVGASIWSTWRYLEKNLYIPLLFKSGAPMCTFAAWRLS